MTVMRLWMLALGLAVLVACGGGEDSAIGAVTPPPPSGLSYVTPMTARAGVLLPALNPTIAGNPASYSVAPPLPDGLSLNPTTGSISGTPTAQSALAVYTVTAANAQGSTTFALSLRVDPPPSAYALSRLVSDGTVAAAATDSRLKDPRGLAALTDGSIWAANNLDHKATAYDGTGRLQPLVVNIPAGVRGVGTVTGVVASSSNSDLVVTNGTTSGNARLLFATESGTISGWSPGVHVSNAILAFDDATDSAVYKGLAIASNGGASFLYAADFHNNRIDVFNGNFARVTASGGFTDLNLPPGYAPSNIQAVSIGGSPVLVVTYARQDAMAASEVAGAGLGLVNTFDLNGNLLKRLIPMGGPLNAPWGIAVAPANFGTLSGALLIGNSGDGRINGFDVNTGAYIHALGDASGSAIVIERLRGIQFGNGAANLPGSTLFVAAGVNGGQGGLLSRLDLGATAPDVVAPVNVAVSSPASAATVRGTATLSATAADNVVVARVLFSVRVGNATAEIATDTTAPFSVDWNSATVANGAATLSATAYDTAGNSTVSPQVAVVVDNAPVTTPTLAMLQVTVFSAQCTGCHNGAGPNLPNSLNLTSASASAAALINVNSLQNPMLKRVNPEDPDNSYLVQKLEGTSIFGLRMPFGGPYLDQVTINQVREWIRAGAAP